MNFSSWYYRNILHKKSDIIEKIIVNEVQLISGEKRWEALAKLDRKIVPHWVPQSKIYGDVDGSGTASHKNIAIHKAISEAIERWAFYYSVDQMPLKHGFDVEESTTGMAAFPALTYFQARRNAKLEALERWGLCAFWRSNLPVVQHKTSISNLEHFEILTNETDGFVSILHFQKGDLSFFGFAAGASLVESFDRAMVELSRNVQVFEGRKFELNELETICDKRLFFFTTEKGLNLFRFKVKTAPFKVLEKPELICDEKIVGDWSRYAKVWRCLYASSYPEDDTDHTFFLF